MIRVTILLAAALALVSGGCGLFASPSVAMVSGRDDHGMLQRAHIGLQASPTDTAVVGTVSDGAFVKVTRREGPWAYVTLVGGGADGWIEDFYLRGEAVHRGPTLRRVRFLDAEPAAGGALVRVRYVDDGSVQWVPSSELMEVGAR